MPMSLKRRTYRYSPDMIAHLARAIHRPQRATDSGRETLQALELRHYLRLGIKPVVQFVAGLEIASFRQVIGRKHNGSMQLLRTCEVCARLRSGSRTGLDSLENRPCFCDNCLRIVHATPPISSPPCC